MQNVCIAGAHRAGKGVIRCITPATANKYGPDWLFADPKKEGEKVRAEHLAALAKEKFSHLTPIPLLLTGKEALAHTADGDTIISAVDTMDGMNEILEGRRASQRAISQIVGQVGGPSGTRLGLGATFPMGDPELETEIMEFYKRLERLSRAESSRVLRNDDPLNFALTPTRGILSARTALHLAEKEREPQDLTGSAANIVLSGTVYPMVAVDGQSAERYSHRRDLALETASKIPQKHLLDRGNGLYSVVAVMGKTALELFVVKEKRKGKRVVEGIAPLVSPLPVPRFVPDEKAGGFGVKSAPSSQPAVFTD